MTVLIVLAVAATLAAALTDARTGHIPNWITFGAFLGGFIVHGVLAFRTGGIVAVPGALLSCLIGAALCALVPLFLYRSRAIGAGDVKLFIALGAIAHSMMGLEMELCGFIAGSLIAPIRLAWEGKLLNTLKRSFYVFANPLLPKARRKDIAAESMTWFRLGPAIFLGTAWVAFSHWSIR